MQFPSIERISIHGRTAVAGVTLMHVVLLFKEKKQHEKIKLSHTGDYKSHWQTTNF